ncbi:MAG: hypothetical protein KF775_02775 [Cyclobacteriaceae bacterium]|nr:hypothetical protein [Cyclobacteriaceae bacterium]
MKNQPALWYTNSSLKVVVIFIFIWLMGNMLILLAMTDFFRSGFQPDKHMPSALLMLASTISTLKIIRNYFRTRTTSN